MSILWDVAGTEEHRGKGGAPKGWDVCSFVLGHSVNSRMTVRSVFAWMESYQESIMYVDRTDQLDESWFFYYQ